MSVTHWVVGGLLVLVVLALAGRDLDFAVGWLNGVVLYAFARDMGWTA